MSSANGKKLLALVAAGTLGSMAVSANAAPYLTVSMLGRVQGSGQPFSSSVLVAPGNVVEYQLNFQLAPEGTTNAFAGAAANQTITNWVTDPLKSGLNNVKFNVGQTSSVGALSAVMLDNVDASGDDGGWNDGAQFTNGAVSGNNLNGLFLQRAPGDFRGTAGNTAATGENAIIEPVLTIASGSFNVSSADPGSSGVVNGSVDTSVTSALFGGFRWRNSGDTGSVNYTPTAGQQLNGINGGSPIVAFNGLSLTTVPEPTALGLLGVAGLGALARRRRQA
jgi:hypothetical protein